jgi:predicted cupin superfamily sugar epimerase
MTPERIIELLALERGTCGYMGLTYRSPLAVAPDAAARRTIGEGLYFLITPTAGVALHRIRSDQLYHHYAGAALEVLLLPDEGPGQVHVVGSDLEAGMRPQLLIPAGTFHVARLADGGEWALLGTTSWPGVAGGEFEAGDAAELERRHPKVAAQLATFATA